MEILIIIFAILGAIDYIFGNKYCIGKEFEKAFKLLGPLSLSMIGMIVIAPFIAYVVEPVLNLINNVSFLEPSVIAGILLANDMGGAPLADSISNNLVSGHFNGLVIGSMMGATISFTLPFVLTSTDKSKHKDILLGLMCGIVTIPIGAIISGFILKMPFNIISINIVPLLIFALLITVGLLKIPEMYLKMFKIFGIVIKVIIIFGLLIGIIQFLTNYKIIPQAAPIEDGIITVFNIVAVMTGMLPIIYIIKKLLRKPLTVFGKKLGINEASSVGLISTLATNVTTFTLIQDMDKKGVIINSAFAVSASFTFADHLAFTMSYKSSYIIAVIVGKLVSGISAVIFALIICNKLKISSN